MNILGFIDDPPREGLVNMAIDDFLARIHWWPEVAAVMRLYRWQRPTLSCGYHQKIDKRISPENCSKFNIDLARRPTGGRELLHDRDLSFAFISYGRIDGESSLRIAKEFFFKVGDVLVKGLESLGVETSIGTGLPKQKGDSLTPCLASTAQYEISSGGKKLIPMAQRLYPDSILVHGSIQLMPSQISTAALLRTGDVEQVQTLINRSSINIQALTGNKIKLESLVMSLKDSYQAVFAGEIKTLKIEPGLLKAAGEKGNNWQIKLAGDNKNTM